MRLFDLDALQELLHALRANVVRTLLTMAGIFWGALALVTTLAFTAGLETATQREMGGVAPNSVFVWGGRTHVAYAGYQPGRYISFDGDDIVALSRLRGIRYLAPRDQLGGYGNGTSIARGAHTGAFQVMGDWPDFRHVQPMRFDRGRFLDEIDLAEGRKVAVIGRQVWTALFPDGSDPIGQVITINGASFMVIGVFHSESAGDQGDEMEQTLHVPFTTFQRVFNTPEVHWFALVGEDHVDAAILEEDVKALLSRRHDVHPEDDALGSYNVAEDFQRVQRLFLGVRGLAWLVGVATLLSGAVGVSNVLTIVVRERTKEIGVRRAIGATPAAIVSMILQEALLMTLTAGMLGIIVGVGLVTATAALVGPNNESFAPPEVAPLTALLLVALLGLVGLVAGWLPARRAAAIHPVEALRAE